MSQSSRRRGHRVQGARSHWLQVLGAICLCALSLSEARADTARRTRAAWLYAAAEKAALTGDYARAAERFERANRLVPSPQAMRSAIRSHLAAGQHRAAITRAEDLLRRYPYDQRSRSLAIETIDQHSARFIRVYITCSAACRLDIDGETNAAPAQTHLAYLPPGKHEIVARFANQTEVMRTIEKTAGQPISLVLDRPEASAPPGPSARVGDTAAVEQPGEPGAGEPGAGTPGEPGEVADVPGASAAAVSATGALRPPRLPLLIGGAATLVLSTAMVWSYQDTIAAEQAPGAMPDALDTRRLRTRILLGATAVSAVATMAVAVIGAQRARGDDAPRGGRGRPEIGMLVDGRTYWIGMTGTF